MWALEVKDGSLEPVEIDEPVAGPGEVVVEVEASSINNADLQRLGGTYATVSDAERVIAGMDVGGTVTAAGEGVDAPAAGERVMSRASGSWAERVAIPARDAIALPGSWSAAEGAAAILGLMTEWHALRVAGRMSSGERVLVRGASSGVGIIAVEVASVLGAGEVVAAVRSERAGAELRERGADGVVVETEAALRGAAGDSGFDVVIDHVGGDLFAEACAALAVGGRLVQVGRLGGHDGSLDLDDLARKRAEVIGVSFRTRSSEQISAIAAGVREELGEALAAGRLRPVIDSTFPLDRASQALERLRRQEHSGKVVLAR